MVLLQVENDTWCSLHIIAVINGIYLHETMKGVTNERNSSLGSVSQSPKYHEMTNASATARISTSTNNSENATGERDIHNELKCRPYKLIDTGSQGKLEKNLKQIPYQNIFAPRSCIRSGLAAQNLFTLDIHRRIFRRVKSKMADYLTEIT